MFRLARFILALLIPGVAAAQTITCEGIPSCSYLQAGTQPVTIVLRVMSGDQPQDGRLIHLTSDKVQPASPLTTTSDGRASFVWTGTVASGESVRIIAQLGAASTDPRTTISIRAATSPTPARRFLQAISKDQTRFTGWELKEPLKVKLLTGSSATSTALPEAQCEKSRVTFRDLGPDDKLESVVTAEFVGAVCIAKTHWVVGKHVGTQRVVVSIKDAPEAHETFRINARKPARVIFGVSFNYSSREFDRAVIDTVRFQIGQIGSMSDPPRDTIAVQPDSTREKARYSVEPMVGVDIPLGTLGGLANRVRVSVAISPTNIDSRLFVGLSVVQLGYGLPMEGTALDLHLGLQFSSLESTRGGKLCITTDTVTNPPTEQCRLIIEKDSKWGLDGITLMGTIDANSFVSSVVSKLGGG